ncbi:hypothetical protein SCA6_001703 [Theobroma cacao]
MAELEASLRCWSSHPTAIDAAPGKWFDSGNCYTVDEAIPKYALKTLLVIFLVLPPDMTDKMMMTANPSQKEVAEDVEDAVLTLMNKYYISVSGNV